MNVVLIIIIVGTALAVGIIVTTIMGVMGTIFPSPPTPSTTKYYTCNETTNPNSCKESSAKTPYTSKDTCNCPTYYQCTHTKTCAKTSTPTAYTSSDECGCDDFVFFKDTKQLAYGNQVFGQMEVARHTSTCFFAPDDPNALPYHFQLTSPDTQTTQTGRIKYNDQVVLKVDDHDYLGVSDCACAIGIVSNPQTFVITTATGQSGYLTKNSDFLLLPYNNSSCTCVLEVKTNPAMGCSGMFSCASNPWSPTFDTPTFMFA